MFKFLGFVILRGEVDEKEMERRLDGGMCINRD